MRKYKLKVEGHEDALRIWIAALRQAKAVAEKIDVPRDYMGHAASLPMRAEFLHHLSYQLEALSHGVPVREVFGVRIAPGPRGGASFGPGPRKRTS